ncbi:MAG: hypothetical protein HOM68_16675 [Gemmatimonadetes bacterium]|nr:hypothetical protein [Gemmatimonadota bacterium]MBT4609558.1 hypothetical protein [Gemmatimonadota bacterium]MBT5058178.1 hypothetical protein [Gemmatimonadota bacterium]MBT5142717.1 hypothetical protein [Gemmatimonadota bacterium]MBT5587693.1 hypothetical protein [Gemmatimonadota bacterium]
MSLVKWCDTANINAPEIGGILGDQPRMVWQRVTDSKWSTGSVNALPAAA